MVVTRRNEGRTGRSIEGQSVWSDAFRRFSLSWSTRGDVTCVPRPYGGQFERLRELGWRRENWPRGGIYASTADLEGVDPVTVARDISEYITLTLDVVPDLVHSLAKVDPQSQNTVIEFLGRWGLLGLGVPARIEKRGFAHVRHLTPGNPVADGVAVTHEVLMALKRLFSATSYDERRRLVDSIRPSIGVTHSLFVTLDLMPEGPQFVHSTSQPITGLIIAALASTPFLTCSECGASFPMGAQERKFCSTRCRVRSHRRHATGARKGRKR